MAGIYNVTIQRGEPWRLTISSWKDSTGATIDPTLYAWVLLTPPEDGLQITGVVSAGKVTFSLTAAQTAALAFQRTFYAVRATPTGGGDATRVLEGNGAVIDDPLT